MRLKKKIETRNLRDQLFKPPKSIKITQFNYGQFNLKNLYEYRNLLPYKAYVKMSATVPGSMIKYLNFDS